MEINYRVKYQRFCKGAGYNKRDVTYVEDIRVYEGFLY